MSISKSWVLDPQNIAEVLRLYRSADIPTVASIASSLRTTSQNVLAVLRREMPEQERKILAKVRYSISKTGSKNPMKGKKGSLHHNWKGDCDDGYGYLTRVRDGQRNFVHRIVMSEALGVEIPAAFDVHHIDGNRHNNAIDNLAIVTRKGHQTIHSLQVQESSQYALRNFTIGEAVKYLTSQSMKTKATNP